MTAAISITKQIDLHFKFIPPVKETLINKPGCRMNQCFLNFTFKKTPSNKLSC